MRLLYFIILTNVSYFEWKEAWAEIDAWPLDKSVKCSCLAISTVAKFLSLNETRKNGIDLGVEFFNSTSDPD